jgi:hypothetical protein
VCAFFACLNDESKHLYVVHASKDRILLEGEEAGADDDGDEEEVFALNGIPSSESDEDEEDAHEEDDDEDEDQPQPVRAGKGSKAKAKAKPPTESDDEEEQESEEEEGWGRKKSAYYSSNAAELDLEDEEANELEEQEAKRIQTKARDAMLDDDFGLADVNQDDMDVIEECVCSFFDRLVVTEMPPVHSSNLSWWLPPNLHRSTRKMRLDTWKKLIQKLSLLHTTGRI